MNLAELIQIYAMMDKLNMPVQAKKIKSLIEQIVENLNLGTTKEETPTTSESVTA